MHVLLCHPASKTAKTSGTYCTTTHIPGEDTIRNERDKPFDPFGVQNQPLSFGQQSFTSNQDSNQVADPIFDQNFNQPDSNQNQNFGQQSFGQQSFGQLHHTGDGYSAPAAPAEESYGAPAAPTYDAGDEYGAPVADVVTSYDAPIVPTYTTSYEPVKEEKDCKGKDWGELSYPQQPESIVVRLTNSS